MREMYLGTFSNAQFLQIGLSTNLASKRLKIDKLAAYRKKHCG